MKLYNVQYVHDPVHDEAVVKAKSIKEAISKVLEVLPDVQIGKVWEIEED